MRKEEKIEMIEVLSKLYDAVIDSYIPKDVELDNEEYNAAVDYQNYLLTEWNQKCNQLNKDDLLLWLVCRCKDKIMNDNVDIKIIYNNV